MREYTTGKSEFYSAVALWARRQRLAERCGERTAADTVETARLPPADGDLGEELNEILDVALDVPDNVIMAIARRKSANVHPDGDSPDGEEFVRIQKAKDVTLGE